MEQEKPRVICLDCKWCDDTYPRHRYPTGAYTSGAICKHPKAKFVDNQSIYVTGKITEGHYACRIMRFESYECGPQGALFERKED